MGFALDAALVPCAGNACTQTPSTDRLGETENGTVDAETHH